MLIIILSFGFIIINEKAEIIFSKKITNKVNSYINDNYKNIKNNIKIGKITYNNKVFKTKIISKENNNLYFYIYYTKGKITDSYKKDYEEGSTLLKHINKKLTKQINKKTNIKCITNSTTTLNKYTDKVKERIIKEDKLQSLKFYYIKNEIDLETWDKTNISNSIVDIISKMQKKEIYPKYYVFIINNTNEITKSIEINNIQEDFINNPNKEDIIKDILNNNNSKLLNDNNITFKYLNE